MTVDNNGPAPRHWWRWFDPRGRDVGTWAFILNRITALGLSVYLFLHLIVLGQLASGQEAYDQFLAMIHNPFYQAAELLLIVGGIFHGLNGLRVALTSFGIAIPAHKNIFWVIIALTLAGGFIFGVKMFIG